MPTFALKTFGCQMNYSDSERVAHLLERYGFTNGKDSKFQDLLVVNTCSIRQKSEDKAYGYMVNKKRQFPKMKIAVTGCMVRKTGLKGKGKDKLLKYNPIDFVFRIEDLPQLPALLKEIFPKEISESKEFGSGTLENYFQIVPIVENKTQVLVPIMQGCNKFCTYCIVPFSRGKELSRPMDEISKECEAHVRSGAKEITLLGQNVNSYTYQGKKYFADLLRKIDALHALGLSRIRFTAPHPQDFTDDVIEALAEMKTSCPYIHLPAQHGSDRILKLMNRNYTAEKYEGIVARLRKKIPEVCIATDIIVGFPGETKDDFQKLLDFGRRVKFDFSYTAIFSPRKGTVAAEKMKDAFISLPEKKKRFAEFDALIKETSWLRRDKAIGKVLEVLVEKSEKQKNGKYMNTGRSREFFEVYFPAGRNYVAQEVAVKITHRDRYILYGEPA